MASGRTYNLEEVIADMDGLMAIPGPASDDEDWSDNDFDGYVDDSDHEQNVESDHEQNIEELGIGGESEITEASVHVDLPQYTYSAGCNHQCTDATPYEFFQMLVTDDILDNIVEQTNVYANQFISSHSLAPRSRVHGWARASFTRQELEKFISLIIVMGLVNLPTLEDHWVTAWPYCSQTCSKVCVL